MTKAARKPPVKKPVSKEKEALEILTYIVDNVDSDTYNDMCDEGKNVLMKAANLLGKTGAFNRELKFDFGQVCVSVPDHLEDDEYEAEVHIKNIRTQKIIVAEAEIESYWD
jgi:hypothetical protein